MSGVAISLDADAALETLARAAASMEEPRELFLAIGDGLVDSTRARFEKEQDPDGNPWPQSLRARVEGGKTLRDTQTLYRSITREAGDNSVSIGTNLIYGAIHQFGGVIKAKTAKGLRFRRFGAGADTIVHSVTIPRRAYLGLDEADRQEIIALADDFLAAVTGGEA